MCLCVVTETGRDLCSWRLTTDNPRSQEKSIQIGSRTSRPLRTAQKELYQPGELREADVQTMQAALINRNRVKERYSHSTIRFDAQYKAIYAGAPVNDNWMEMFA